MKFLPYLLLTTLICCLSFTPPAKRIEWVTKTRHDFGVLKQNIPASHIFVFKNISKVPLTIDNVRTSCGCTSPQWETTVVMPDSLGMIKLEFDAYKMGFFQKFARVFFNGQRKSEKLVIEGEVVEAN